MLGYEIAEAIDEMHLDVDLDVIIVFDNGPDIFGRLAANKFKLPASGREEAAAIAEIETRGRVERVWDRHETFEERVLRLSRCRVIAAGRGAPSGSG